MRGTTLCGILSILGQVMSQQASYQPGTGGGFPGSGGGRIGGGGGGIGGGGAGGEGGLDEAIPGIPGEDYPIYSEVPETSFFCDGQVDGGYYGDPEAECQAFHICASDGNGGLTKYSFLCPNGTLFNQQYFVCDWWFNVDCSTTEDFYSLNDEIAAEREANSPGGGQGQYNGAGGRSNDVGAKAGAAQKGNRKPLGSSGFRGAASSPRGSYSSPSSSYSAGDSFGAGDSYSAAGSGYGAPPASYTGSRRNARGASIVSRSLGSPIDDLPVDSNNAEYSEE